MPGITADGSEYLVLVVGERTRCQASLAPIGRRVDAPPALGEWRDAAKATGMFAEPLAAACGEPLVASRRSR